MCCFTLYIKYTIDVAYNDKKLKSFWKILFYSNFQNDWSKISNSIIEIGIKFAYRTNINICHALMK